MPGAAERDERLGSVLHVLYLIFNEGYTASAGAALHRAARRAHRAEGRADPARRAGPQAVESGSHQGGRRARQRRAGAGRDRRYQLQAAIAAVHDEAPRAEGTDWPQIRGLYDLLKRVTDNPLVALNHAIATAMVDGPNAGLALLAPLQDDVRLRGSHRLDAVRAHLLERAGEREAAVSLSIARPRPRPRACRSGTTC